MKNTQKIFMGIAVLIIASVFCVAASKPMNRKNNEDNTTTTATAEVNSPEKAIDTIKQYISKEDITIAEDNYYIPKEVVTPVLVTDTEKSEDYNYWNVVNPDQHQVIFLYNNDENAISTNENSTRDFISDEYVMDVTFKNDEYNNSGAFAWNCNGCSNAVLGKKAGFKCSSIWTFDENSNQVSLIWYDSEADVWQNYQ